MAADLPTSVGAPRTLWAQSGAEDGQRQIPEETPVALVHDATTTAVMMATPADLEDFALGFSLTEGIVASPAEVRSVEVVETPLGMEARVWLQAPQSAALAARRRQIVGPAGCGLCGIDSLAEAVRTPKPVGVGFSMRREDVHAALNALTAAQRLGALTRGVHAAGWWTLSGGLHAIREDVGRHNALDKLVGALAREDVAPATGAVVLTSRLSVEMIQKAAAFGAQVVIAVSAPTALAIRTAEAAGVTVVAIARDDSFEVFTHPERIGA